MKNPRAILMLGGMVERLAQARPQQPPHRDACSDAIAALAEAGLPLFERMRAEGRCLPMQIGIWREIAARTDPVSHAALSEIDCCAGKPRFTERPGLRRRRPHIVTPAQITDYTAHRSRLDLHVDLIATTFAVKPAMR